MAMIKDFIVGADGIATVVFDIDLGRSTVSCSVEDSESLLATVRDSSYVAQLGEKYYSAGKIHPMPVRPSDSHVFNWVTKQWEDPRTLSDLRAEKWASVKAQRDAQEFGSFTWSGHTFDGDEAAQRRINLAVMGAQAALIAGDAGWSVDWTLADNTSVNLSATDMMEVANALGANIAQAHTVARAKRQLIQAATTPAELDAI